MQQGYRPPGDCPVCGKGLSITRLECSQCDTALTGTFEPCSFCRLSPGMYHFLQVLLTARGNIREVEKKLSISYPTVRARLDELLNSLGFQEDTIKSLKEKRRQVLEEVKMGKITSEEALKLLQEKRVKG